LRAFAKKLSHPATSVLERPYVDYVANQPTRARDRFYGLKEAKADLVGFCLFDRISDELQTRPELIEYAWKRCEIENYIVYSKDVLIDWACSEAEEQSVGPLFAADKVSIWLPTMQDTIKEIEDALVTLGKGSPWSPDTKVSTDFLDPLFTAFFNKLELPNLMQKTNYHTLVQYVRVEQIDPEVTEVLDAISEVANKAVCR
jgi:hypothetical protein